MSVGPIIITSFVREGRPGANDLATNKIHKFAVVPCLDRAGPYATHQQNIRV